MKEKQSFIQWLTPSFLTCTFFIFFVALIGTFLFLLDQKLDRGFGAVQILFTFIAAFLITSLLVWVKTILRKNPYLGMISGLVIIVLLVQALFTKYKGPYTLMFAGIGALASVGYVVYHFFTYRAQESKK